MKIQVAEYAAGVTVQNVYLANVLGPLDAATGSNPSSERAEQAVDVPGRKL
ncbi:MULTISPECIES: hypothetical protein [unclassified Streptomyces]|uniref:hypothetical protein n=1 Tax=unclassified Streptomyces TaxID=2593676 RepID=UPI00081E733D|nr:MULTISPECIES: hypothetical protein [unclassified Streptomyces]SCF47152.1 hypothetical protein GA0115257_1185174 [Streptomyces sp. LcepLS]